MADESFVTKVRNNPLFKSFLFYSAFRAVYGFGILLFAYFFATSTEAPWWATVLIFIASMIFSRILFKFIKSKRGLSETPSK
jgi:biotin transporter BioY